MNILGGGLDGPLPNLPHEVAPAKPALEQPLYVFVRTVAE